MHTHTYTHSQSQSITWHWLGCMKCMVECTPINVLCSWPLFITSLLYDDPPLLVADKTAYRNLGCWATTNKHTHTHTPREREVTINWGTHIQAHAHVVTWYIIDFLVVDLHSSLAYFDDPSLPIASKFPIKTLVARQLPTNIHTKWHIHTHEQTTQNLIHNLHSQIPSHPL